MDTSNVLLSGSTFYWMIHVNDWGSIVLNAEYKFDEYIQTLRHEVVLDCEKQ